jgi:hypothetical protein
VRGTSASRLHARQLGPRPASGTGHTPKSGIRHINTDAPLYEDARRSWPPAATPLVKVTETMVATRLIGPLSKADSDR